MYYRQSRFNEAASCFERELSSYADVLSSSHLYSSSNLSKAKIATALTHKKLGLLYAYELNDTVKATVHMDIAMASGLMDTQIRKFLADSKVTNQLSSNTTMGSSSNTTVSEIIGINGTLGESGDVAIASRRVGGFGGHRWVARPLPELSMGGTVRGGLDDGLEKDPGATMKSPLGLRGMPSSLVDEVEDSPQASSLGGVGGRSASGGETAFEAMNRMLEEQQEQREADGIDDLGATGESSMLSSMSAARRSNRVGAATS